MTTSADTSIAHTQFESTPPEGLVAASGAETDAPALTSAATYPLVVIVTPVYNGAAYLRETMESVQAQTWPNLLHLVIDNASTDATPEIIADFMDRRVPVKVIRHPETIPQIPNWNSGIANLPEETVWFRILCADDTIQPENVEKMVRTGEQDPLVGAVGCTHDCNGEIEPSLWDPDQTIYDGQEALRRFFDNQGLIIAPQVLFHRQTIVPGEPFFSTEVACFDTDCVLRLLQTWKWGFISEHLGFSRDHADTVTAREMTPKRMYLYHWYEWMHSYGAFAYGDKRTAEGMRKRFRRHYLRRLMIARRQEGNDRVWNIHMEMLDKLGEKPTVLDLADAIADWALIPIGLRKRWYPYPW